MPEHNAARLRSLRKKSGLTQKELAVLLGFTSDLAISRHERSKAIPHLLTALGYEVIFGAKIADQFLELHLSVESVTEQRLQELEARLQALDAKGRNAACIARVLEFLCMRRNPELNTGNNEA
jgi:transcriptional regulator with XRE-family HTH domain